MASPSTFNELIMLYSIPLAITSTFMKILSCSHTCMTGLALGRTLQLITKVYIFIITATVNINLFRMFAYDLRYSFSKTNLGYVKESDSSSSTLQANSLREASSILSREAKWKVGCGICQQQSTEHWNVLFISIWGTLSTHWKAMKRIRSFKTWKRLSCTSFQMRRFKQLHSGYLNWSQPYLDLWNRFFQAILQ